jgi:hypothetical protein
VKHVVCIREAVNLYRILTERTEGKIPLGRYRHGWENNIKMDFKK